jgi:hypothetical protein
MSANDYTPPAVTACCINLPRGRMGCAYASSAHMRPRREVALSRSSVHTSEQSANATARAETWRPEISENPLRDSGPTRESGERAGR